VKHQKLVFLALLLATLTVSLTMPCLAQDNETDTDQNGELEAVIITTVQAVWFVGSFIGSICRLTWPLPRHRDDISSEGFNQRYTGTTILTILLALIITGLAFPMATIPEDFNTLFSLFWLAFASGYGGNAAIIEISEYLT